MEGGARVLVFSLILVALGSIITTTSAEEKFFKCGVIPRREPSGPKKQTTGSTSAAAHTDHIDTAVSSTGQEGTTGAANVTADGGTTGTITVTADGGTTWTTTDTAQGVTTGTTTDTAEGVTTGTTTDAVDGGTTGTTTATAEGVTAGTTTATAEGVTTGTITDTVDGGTTGTTSDTARGFTTGTTTVTANGGTTTVAKRPLSPSAAKVVPDDATTPCPPNMVQGNCTCPGTCEKPDGSSACPIDYCPETVGCHCPDGFLMSGNDCVPRSECPCFWSGVNIVIPNGQYRVNSDCTKRRSCTNNELTAEEDYQCRSDAQCDARDGIRQCYCNDRFHGDGQNCDPLYADCNDAYKDGQTQDGVYLIKPTNWPWAAFNVPCVMSKYGGGWTVFQRRKDGHTNFYRNWTSYREGFGSFDGDFWLGNEKIHYLTNQKAYKLRIDFQTSWSDETDLHVEYSSFRIGAKEDDYSLAVDDVGTNAGKAMYYNEGRAFSTYDRDNDGCEKHNFAERSRGAWWYGNDHCSWEGPRPDCQYFQLENSDGEARYGWVTHSNLNGDYDGGDGQNIFCSGRPSSGGHDPYCNLIFAEMKIRPSHGKPSE